MITRECIICGKKFQCYPSDKNVTCSKECRKERQRRIVLKKPVLWGEEAKEKLSQKGQTENLKKGKEAAKKSPKAGRFETNINAKTWILIDPTGKEIIVKNLLLWARENAELFDKEKNDKSSKQIRAGFAAIAQTIKGNRGTTGKPRGATTYKGWTLKEMPKKE